MDLWRWKPNDTGPNDIKPIAFKTLLMHSKDMIFIKNTNLVYIAASPLFARMVGKESVEEVIGKTDFEIFEDQTLARRYVSDDRKLLAGNMDLMDYIEPIPDDNGKARYGSTSKHILRDDNGNYIGILGITRDITRYYLNRQQQQRELKYLFELPADAYSVTYIDVTAWRIVSQRKQEIDNATYQSCHTVESLVEAALDSIVDKESDAIQFYRRFNPSYLSAVYESGRRRLSFQYQRIMSDGSKHWVYNVIRFIWDVESGHLCVMLTARNIDEQKLVEEQLIQSAHMDKMTMLLNRETTMETIQNTLSEQPDKIHAFFMIDVDNFKKLNDTYGHQAGDAFLVRFAKEIKDVFEDDGIAGRIGGDEFFAMIQDVPDIGLVQARAEELLANVQKVCAGYEDVHLSASIGVSLYPINGRSIGQVYANADKAMYQAKNKGKNQIVFLYQNTDKEIKVDMFDIKRTEQIKI